MRDLMIGGAESSKTSDDDDTKKIPHDEEEEAYNASCNKLSNLLARIQTMTTVDEATEVLSAIIEECKSCGAFEIDAIVEEVYESISGNEYYDKIKAADSKGTVVRKLLKLEKIQGAEYVVFEREEFITLSQKYVFQSFYFSDCDGA